MTARIDFNCDMGESFGSYKLGQDEEVIKYITSANVACGFHAGDPQWMRHTVKLAEEHGVAVGAHPSFPDLQGFGRRNMVCHLRRSEERRDVPDRRAQSFYQRAQAAAREASRSHVQHGGRRRRPVQSNQ